MPQAWLRVSIMSKQFAWDDVHPLPPMKEEKLAAIAEELAGFPMELLGRRDQDRQYVSPAQIKTAKRCLEQYRRRYVLGEKEAPNHRMVWGGADHTAQEMNYRQKLVSGTDLPPGEVEVAFAAALDERVEQEGGPAEVVWDDKQPYMTAPTARKAMAEVKDRGAKLAGFYAREVAPAVQPTSVEQEFTTKIEGLPVPVFGYIDLVATEPIVGDEPEPGTIREPRVIERKTTGQRRISGEWIVQGRVYQLEVPIPVNFHLSLKLKNPAVSAGEFIYPVPSRDLIIAQVQRTMAEVAFCYRIYGPDQPWPDAIHHAWACGYCGWGPKGKNDCPWWNDQRWAKTP